MHLRHIVAAADDSEEGRGGVLAAARLAQRCGARVTVLTVAEAMQGADMGPRVLAGLKGMVARTLSVLRHPPTVDLGVAIGLPGVEIGRFAEENAADLVVIGRKRRSEMQRLMIGDTADSVARRSRTPCLFVLAGEFRFDRLLVALDGSDRSLGVLVAALDFTRDLGSRVRAVTVEPAYENETGAPRLLTGRSERLLEAIEDLRRSTDLGRGRWEPAREGAGTSPVMVHRGRVVEEIVSEVEVAGADVLVVGYRRGGPAGVIDAGSVARRLTHEAPCSVLTIPL